MSVCTFFASDCPLPPVAPEKTYPIMIDVDRGTVEDGDADDNFFLHPFLDVDRYAGKPWGVWLEWRYTEGRAKQLLAYLQRALEQAETVEMWHVWLRDYWEYEDRPILCRYEATIGDLTAADLRELDEMPIWESANAQRPIFSCLTVRK